MTPTILAIACVRNEALHMRRLIEGLRDDGIALTILDNGSTDGTREIAECYLGSGVVRIADLPWTGAFSLSEQLRAKSALVAEAREDWIVHIDADEWLHPPEPGRTLAQGIAEADARGANCVNFEEFVFLPRPGRDHAHEGYAGEMRDYYYFRPRHPRLVRAWKRTAGLTNLATGGHTLRGGAVRRHATDFVLRHYIALSEAHARGKYLGRVFADEDLARGWHARRRGITAELLSFRDSPTLRTLPTPASRDFDRSEPSRRHFWEW
ncbi:glycosyltransferase [Jannaschia formosa]|uniref:glycosyltransferase n=1 Tax=Jannaschia formosa TaxID=2259592 RepID=UPI000E1B78B3|nr:glycosyltransferase [Jannaschia formosa]TFL16931.1 glycosyltransferase [Jannaschia formosa]